MAGESPRRRRATRQASRRHRQPATRRGPPCTPRTARCRAERQYVSPTTRLSWQSDLPAECNLQSAPALAPARPLGIAGLRLVRIAGGRVSAFRPTSTADAGGACQPRDARSAMSHRRRRDARPVAPHKDPPCRLRVEAMKSAPNAGKRPLSAHSTCFATRRARRASGGGSRHRGPGPQRPPRAVLLRRDRRSVILPVGQVARVVETSAEHLLPENAERVDDFP